MNISSCIPCKHYKTDLDKVPCKYCRDHSKFEEHTNSYAPWTPPFRFEVTSIFDSKGHRICDMRGWGFLTGGSACNLPTKEAAKIQDAMGAKIAALMNKDAGL